MFIVGHASAYNSDFANKLVISYNLCIKYLCFVLPKISRSDLLMYFFFLFHEYYRNH